ncbi:DciA family protein [Acuticoccus sp. M5D2P5]|uniref:DUF721 domain-containing protein n=1 Tax=Acuticoccus kalidii TaxID=2910977 RepID=UPI001F34B84D|nr:DciA family protein [Acuticoccus kalidii]MCF3936058.1 DciA family protein [Acuticoccus kalidii]
MSTIKRNKGARPLAELIGDLVTPACRRRGVANIALMLEPADIFGERFAKAAVIERIVWPKGSRIDSATGATLIVRADASTALALQHLSPQIIERVNILIGWPAIARLRLTQTRGRAVPPPRHLAPIAPAPPPPDPERAAAIAEGLTDITHQNLKAALSRLGASIERRGSTSARKRP